MPTPEITYDSHIGSTITDTIDHMIATAAAQRAVVKTEFNEVAVRVRADSIPDLIYRDWSRAMSGYIDKTVGPYPNAKLTAAEKANDARIKKENEQRRQEADAKYAAEAKVKSDATTARLAVAPPMELVDEAAWQSSKDANTDPYGSGIIRYAEAWARLMQAEIANGAALEDIADDTSHVADVEGVTGFMHGAAVALLAECWVHGDRLRQWHNRKWGVGKDREGTVNPAIWTIGSED
jgi:hypothetical protein